MLIDLTIPFDEASKAVLPFYQNPGQKTPFSFIQLPGGRLWLMQNARLCKNTHVPKGKSYKVA